MNKMVLRILIPFVMGIMVSVAFATVIYEPDNNIGVSYASYERDEIDEIEQPLDSPETALTEDEEENDVTSLAETPESKQTRGGELEWVYTAKEGEVSTPALVDLDSDGFLEVVVVTTGDEIIALNNDGEERWKNSNYVIEAASYFSGELNLDFWPADLFSSVTPANIDRDVRPELILGAYNGLVFLNHDGDPKYSQAHTGRYYFSTPVVCDLEGDYSKIDVKGDPVSYYKDFEILTGSDDEQRNAYLEAWHATGGDVFDYTVRAGGESAFVLGIAVGDLDGSMEDEVYRDNEEAWMEIIFATHDKGMRIYEYQPGNDQMSSAHGHYHPSYDEDTSFTVQGHLSYATAAVGNFSKVVNPQDPNSLEIIIGKGGWHGGQPGTPITSGAGLFCIDQDGQEKWSAMDGKIVISSPAVGDIHCEDRDEATKLKAEYEIFACNSHEGEIYCIDADDGTELWHWEIEGAKSSDNRILSSPAICNINSDSELEVVVGSDNGKVYCFDGDPSDAVNDGEEYALGGEGTGSFDLLWMFDTHEYSDKVTSVGKIGISSPVVADIDKDGVLEVIIGDTVGNIWCIGAGGTCSRGQRDWTMFHYDTNNSGFYDPRVSYSVDVKMAIDDNGLIDTREKYVEPGEMVIFNLSVINDGTGLSQDDFDNVYVTSYIASNLTNTGWKYTLKGDAIKEHDGLQYVRLPMQESANIKLNVTAPWSGEMGDYISIVIKVNSSMDNNAMASTFTMTHLLIKIDFNLEFNWLPESDPQSPYYNKKLDEIEMGEERTYTISVSNIGNINDTYRISVVDYERSWDIKFLDSPDPLNYTLPLDSSIFADFGAENSTQIQLSVRIPAEGQPGGAVTYISLEGVSLLSENEQKKSHPLMGLIVRQDTMLIKIGEQAKLVLETDEGEKYIMPGEKAKYKIRVINNGNVDYTVAISHSEPSNGWVVTMAKKSVDVGYGGQSAFVELFLTAPGEEYHVKAETREMITIKGEVDTAKGIISSSVGIVGVMDSVYHLNVSVSPSVNTTSPGGIVNYFVTIENLGNGDDEIKLSPLSLELGWNMTFSKGSEFYIEWKETITIQFELRVPINALANTYVSTLNVSDSNPDEKNFVNVKTVVLQSYDVSIGTYNEDFDLYMSTTTQFVTPGSSTMFDLRVTNNGNGEDDVMLDLFVYKYEKPTGEFTKTKLESKQMLDESIKSGGVRWFFKSVQSSPGAFTTEPRYMDDFTKKIDVDSADEIRYQPKSDLQYASNLLLNLYSGQSAWVQVEVEYPSDEVMDPMYFAVEAISNGTDIRPGDNRCNMTLEIKYSDLAFDTSIGDNGLEVIGKKTEENPQLNIRVKIRNIGEIDARDIEIAMYVDGQFLDSRTVMRLVNSTKGDYKDILISFTWKPIEGKHKIEVKIDPDNSIVESNEKNNEASDDINIKGQSSVTNFLGKKGTCPIIVVIVAAVIIGTASYFVLRKKKQPV